MAREFSASTVIDRPVDEVFAFLEKISDAQTRITIRNTLEGHGVGKVIVGFAVKAAVKDAPAFAQRIKSAVEAS